MLKAVNCRYQNFEFLPWMIVAVLSSVLLLPMSGLRAQEVECDNSVYVATHISTGTSLYRFRADTLNGITELEEIFTDNQEYRIGCMGYSVVDKMIYAIELNTYELLRINALGEITSLGVPNGLNTNLEYLFRFDFSWREGFFHHREKQRHAGR